jgi:hypothetical protein
VWGEGLRNPIEVAAMTKLFVAEVIIEMDVRSTNLNIIKISSDETSAVGSSPITVPNLTRRLTEDDIVSAIPEITTD